MIGVVEPGLRSVLAVTDTDRVGVIGTVGTIASGAYQRAADGSRAPDRSDLCGVPRVRRVRRAGRDRLGPGPTCWPNACSPRSIDAKVDALLLGCTHYPFLARTIGDVMGRDVVLVSSADETAFAVTRTLEASSRALLRATGEPGRHIGSCRPATSPPSPASAVELLGPELDTVQAHRWETA